MKNAIDCRALDDKEIEVLRPGGILYPFVKLVSDHSELQLCFRGNGSPKYISIYFNNRESFKVYINGKVEISYRTARYWEKCEEGYNSLLKKYHFKPNKDFVSFLKSNSLILYKMVERDDNYEQIYTEIIYPMLYNYCENIDKFDYFKWKCDAQRVERSHPENEKKAQQRLYKAFEHLDGYFFYDMEYHQKGSKNSNEPDMLGVYFDEKGAPRKIVFVEVKSTKYSINDPNPKGSGLYGHLVKSKEYIKDGDLMETRKEEAYCILNNYAALGLRNLNPNSHFDKKEFDTLEPQVLFLFSGDVKDYVEKNNLSLKKYKREIGKKDIDYSAYVIDKTGLLAEDLWNLTQQQSDSK